MAESKESDIKRTITVGGAEMPMVGFGCAFGNWTGATEYQGFLPEQAWRAISLAYDAGFRHFDTAHVYGTERHLGDILGRHFQSGELSRDDVWLTTKVAHPITPPNVSISGLLSWNPGDVPDIGAKIIMDFESSLDKVGIGYFSLGLLHWPGKFDETDEEFARSARKQMWTAMEKLHARGSAKAIGVCNFSIKHLEQLKEDCTVVPAVNQIEVHPYCQDKPLLDYCKANGIVVEAFAPFASGAFGLLTDPVLTAIAETKGVSVGQVILRWHIQQGRVAVPKSTSAKRIPMNVDVWSFSLSEEEMDSITALGDAEVRRTCPAPESIV